MNVIYILLFCRIANYLSLLLVRPFEFQVRKFEAMLLFDVFILAMRFVIRLVKRETRRLMIHLNSSMNLENYIYYSLEWDYYWKNSNFQLHLHLYVGCLIESIVG